MPSPKSVDPIPQPNPKSMTFASTDHELFRYTFASPGTVASAKLQGMMTIATTEYGSQIFSQRQPVIFFMGRTKLPFMTPPASTQAIPQNLTVDILSSGLQFTGC